MLAIHRLISVLSRDIEMTLDGTPERDGLIQSLRANQDEFASAVWRSAPDFKPRTDTAAVARNLKKANAIITSRPTSSRDYALPSVARSTSHSLPAPDFLSKEEQRNFFADVHLQITFDEVLGRAQRYDVAAR